MMKYIVRIGGLIVLVFCLCQGGCIITLWLYSRHTAVTSASMYEDFTIDKIQRLDFRLHVYHEENGTYPDTLSDLWKGRSQSEFFIRTLSQDIRGNPVQYRFPPLNNKDKPDVWIIDAQSGKMYKNW